MFARNKPEAAFDAGFVLVTIEHAATWRLGRGMETVIIARPRGLFVATKAEARLVPCRVTPLDTRGGGAFDGALAAALGEGKPFSAPPGLHRVRCRPSQRYFCGSGGSRLTA